MQKDSRLFDDFARLASGAAGSIADMKREVEALVMDKVEKLLARMNLVRREEYEVTRAMAEKARAEQEQIAAKLAELEKRLDSLNTTPAPARNKTQK